MCVIRDQKVDFTRTCFFQKKTLPTTVFSDEFQILAALSGGQKKHSTFKCIRPVHWEVISQLCIEQF